MFTRNSLLIGSVNGNRSEHELTEKHAGVCAIKHTNKSVESKEMRKHGGSHGDSESPLSCHKGRVAPARRVCYDIKYEKHRLEHPVSLFKERA